MVPFELSIIPSTLPKQVIRGITCLEKSHESINITNYMLTCISVRARHKRLAVRYAVGDATRPTQTFTTTSHQR